MSSSEYGEYSIIRSMCINVRLVMKKVVIITYCIYNHNFFNYQSYVDAH